ncbi:hypothetical protein HYV86_01725 [Candidatus Woesearchaeota archaeon]|nr:hypothetical protein [Candidatus Woesearchaeota archaeon]
MVNPQFIEEKPASISEVKEILAVVEDRDAALGYRATRTKDFIEGLSLVLSSKKRETMQEKLVGLNLTRLREEHIIKIIDFCPTTVGDLKTVLQAYPLSMSKTDQEAIVQVVKECM